jgi:transcriptional regulator with XRE-family HTH domain
MRGMEPILSYVVRNIRSIHHSRWDALADACGVSKSAVRKIAYHDRSNPTVQTIQPLVTFFQQVDAGTRSLDELTAEQKAS